jgi:hypothetical protein
MVAEEELDFRVSATAAPTAAAAATATIIPMVLPEIPAAAAPPAAAPTALDWEMVVLAVRPWEEAFTRI